MIDHLLESDGPSKRENLDREADAPYAKELLCEPNEQIIIGNTAPQCSPNSVEQGTSSSDPDPREAQRKCRAAG